MNTSFQIRIGELLNRFGYGPIFVHSDVSRVMKAIKPTTSRTDLLNRHIEALTAAANGRDTWFPTFNYGFLRCAHFDTRTTPSEVGALSEHARTHWAKWRTAVPVFSVCGQGQPPAIKQNGALDPFGGDSIFAHLIRSGGTLCFYGAPFHSATLLHHVERRSGGPVYRYDKQFPGIVTDDNGQDQEIVLNYHVRPMGQALDYDWPRLTEDLIRAELMGEVRDGASTVLAISASALADFWHEALQADPLYLLNAQSRSWVAPLHKRLGRRFTLEDFE